MARATRIHISSEALLHNVARVKELAPGRGIIAMTKANAYGCGIAEVVPVIASEVDMFGVACLDEALAIRSLGCERTCLLLEGVFSIAELHEAAENQFSCVIHNAEQLQWILDTPLKKPLNVWVKVNTGMHRLGFPLDAVPNLAQALQGCAWVQKELGLMTHFACADEPERPETLQQIKRFQTIDKQVFSRCSLANSAGLIAFPQAQAEMVRPGIMLYGVSPFADKTGQDLQLKPVMHLTSEVTTIRTYEARASIGYGGIWTSDKPCIIGMIPVGYGDGYPRHIAANTPVWIQGQRVPIVGRVSMDMLTIDLTNHLETITPGTPVELWGDHIAIEHIAKSAGTIAYELLCQVTNRARGIF